jgi:hypothetical protein
MRGYVVIDGSHDVFWLEIYIHISDYDSWKTYTGTGLVQ